MSVAEFTIPFKLLRLGEEGVHILVKVSLGRRRADMIIDTGASQTVFDLTFIRNIYPEKVLKPLSRPSAGVGGGDIQGSMVVIPRMKVGGMVIASYCAAAIDFSHVNAYYQSMGLGQIHGVLGGDLLLKTKARIDYRTHEIIIQTPEV